MVAVAEERRSLNRFPERICSYRSNQSNWLTLSIGDQRVGLSKYRLYDADLGVFLSRDFLRFLNKYRAWSNNPVGQVDRDGLASADPWPRGGIAPSMPYCPPAPPAQSTTPPPSWVSPSGPGQKFDR